MIVDAHVHLYEFSESSLRKYKNYILLSVAEDYSSSLKNIRLAMLYENVIPAVGIHPWNVEKTPKEMLTKIQELVDKTNIKVLGEIGLDKKFVPHSYNKQLEFFKFFLDLAKEYNLSVNLHCPDAWREVFDLAIKYDIQKAYFHWYTGPSDLLEKIQQAGYFVGINPALVIQKKHLEILNNVKIQNILTESDGPYKYRNLYLVPELINDVVKKIAEMKNLEEKQVIEAVQKNLSKFLA